MKQTLILLFLAFSSALLPAQNVMVFDTTFGTGGQVYLSANDWNGRGLLQQPDGKIIFFGEQRLPPGNSNRNLQLARLTPDGALDTSFNHNGLVVTDVPYKLDFEVGSALLQPDGKILVIASGRPPSINSQKALIFRYNPDGIPDTTFGTNGLVRLPLDSFSIYKSIMQLVSNGNILVGSDAIDNTEPQYAPRAILYRLKSNGQMDSTYGINGVSRLTDSLIISLEDLTTLANDTIYVIGYDATSTDLETILLKIAPDGTIANAFHISPLLNTPADAPFFKALALQPDGKILCSGNSSVRSILVRLLPNGTLDPSFNGDGVLLGGYGTGFSGINQILILPGNKILTAFTWVFEASIFNEKGNYDYTFNKNGHFIAPHPDDGDPNYLLDISSGIVVQADSKIVMAGTINNRLFVARYRNKSCLNE